jgi:hypothetical protein
VKPSDFPALASSARWANSFKIMKHYVQGHVLRESWLLSRPIRYLLASFNFFIAVVSLMPQTSSPDLYSAEIRRFQPEICTIHLLALLTLSFVLMRSGFAHRYSVPYV